jgi:hypothetical protein
MDDTFIEILRKLDRIISLLEKISGDGTATQPTLPDLSFPVKPPHCSKCGISLEGVTGYVCNHADCPTGLGATTC